MTPIYEIATLSKNQIFIKRDDLHPISFGGNKARKAELFFYDMEGKQADCIVTYGTTSSNHCRIIANLAAKKNLPCWIVSPNGREADNFNSRMVRMFGAQYVFCPVSNVSKTIERLLLELRQQGRNPYFIQGGGHGNLGTQAYVNAYSEICDWENANNVHFDYIFHASGTGTTQAGLVCGQLLNRHFDRRIVGISIARTLPRGRDVVIESIKNYLASLGKSDFYRNDCVCFDDAYVCGGYGVVNKEIREVQLRVMKQEGIPLCGTYTAKAYWGMESYLKSNQISDKNILFIHTGGTPLFFDDLKDFKMYEYPDSQRRDAK